MPCRRGSTSGSRRISKRCWRRCSSSARPRTSPAWRAASRSSSSRRSACWSGRRSSEDVKGLDQPARAGLRKYGVRFGAYHIYFPALLKPTPRALATQLFALKHAGPESKGIEAIEQLAKSGRTSIAADKDVDRTLYRVAGYRVCGERAVRADILERIADIIRPALAWRSGAPGIKPPGALDGSGFTGRTGDDVAGRLCGRGIRVDPARAWATGWSNGRSRSNPNRSSRRLRQPRPMPPRRLRT